MARTKRYTCPTCGQIKILGYSAIGEVIECNDCGTEFEANDNEHSNTCDFSYFELGRNYKEDRDNY